MTRRRANPDRVAAIFRGCSEQPPGDRTACRVAWLGALGPDGKQPPVKMLFGRREDRLRAVYRLRHGGRLKRTDIIEQTCGNARCVDWRHLRLVPAPTAEAAPANGPCRETAPIAKLETA